MASCGSSNPLQAAKDHLQRDTTLQHEQVAAAAQPWLSSVPGFRSSPAPRQPGDTTASAQFDSFNQFSPNVGTDARGMRMNMDVPQTNGSTGYLSERDPLAHGVGQHGVGQQWAAEFQQQVPHQAATTQDSLMAMAGPRPGNAQWSGIPSAYGPMAAGVMPTVGVNSAVPQPQRAAPAPPDDAVFEELFAAFEKKLEAEKQGSQQVDEQKPDAQKDAEDLSSVATQIMSSLNSPDTERSAQLAEKMQSSKFMALMDKLKSSEIKANKTDFVESDGTKVDPHTLESANLAVSSNSQNTESPSAVQQETQIEIDKRANADWPPQRREKSGPAPFGRSLRDAKYLVGLEDPDTYFKKLKASLQATNDLIQSMPSPFEAARDLGSKSIQVGDWEEHYESW